MSATSARDLAAQKARHDTQSAYHIAKKIDEPWYRGQALAWVARFAPENRFDTIVQEAVKACLSAEDPYERVAAVAWPMRAMIERGRTHKATAVVDEVLPLVSSIHHPIRRASALHMLLQATLHLEQARIRILEEFIKTSREFYGWRGTRLLKVVALMLGDWDPDSTQRIIEAMPEGRDKRQAVRRMREGRFFPAHPFFWG